MKKRIGNAHIVLPCYLQYILRKHLDEGNLYSQITKVEAFSIKLVSFNTSPNITIKEILMREYHFSIKMLGVILTSMTRALDTQFILHMYEHSNGLASLTFKAIKNSISIFYEQFTPIVNT